MNFKFKNGDIFPEIALGTWRLFPSEIEEPLKTALAVGYQGIDTAQAYTNEMTIGRTIGNAKTFITTKVDPRNYKHYVVESIKMSLKRLNRTCVDLVLLHWPNDDFELMVKVYKQILEAKKMGLTKHAGVSNANIQLLKLINEKLGEYPEVNQFEYNVLNQRKDLVQFCHQHDIIVTGYQTMAVLFEHHALTIKQRTYLEKLAHKYNVSLSNILLRHSLQNKISIIPKSKNPKRVKENIKTLSFELSRDEMNELNSWDQAKTTEESIMDNYKGVRIGWQARGNSHLYSDIQTEHDWEKKYKAMQQEKKAN